MRSVADGPLARATSHAWARAGAHRRSRHRRSAIASLFEGGDEIGVSIFVTAYERGQGPALHLHPYPEVFVVETGTAVFTVGDEELTVTGGHVWWCRPGRRTAPRAPATTRRVVRIHPSTKVEQTDLEP